MTAWSARPINWTRPTRFPSRIHPKRRTRCSDRPSKWRVRNLAPSTQFQSL
ncbi:Uncharacterised protein [Vibrio cholerae]|nr:Uncharacterised protein [Vibrio cholerae]